MKYAGEVYGGQRATIGRIVVIHTDEGIGAGVIDHFKPENEQPAIVQLTPHEVCSYLGFVETKTAADVEAMPLNSWTWPPRI